MAHLKIYGLDINFTSIIKGANSNGRREGKASHRDP
jgi:hypothetical protein